MAVKCVKDIFVVKAAAANIQQTLIYNNLFKPSLHANNVHPRF